MGAITGRVIYSPKGKAGENCRGIVSLLIGICLTMKKSEIRVEVPADCRLVGVKTDGDIAIIIYEPIQNVRQIGFVYCPEPAMKARTKPIIRNDYAV